MEHCVFLMRSQNLEVSRLALLPAALPLVHRRKMMIRRLPSIYHGGGRGAGRRCWLCPLCLSPGDCGDCWSEKLGRIRISCREKKKRAFGRSGRYSALPLTCIVIFSAFPDLQIDFFLLFDQEVYPILSTRDSSKLFEERLRNNCGEIFGDRTS